MNIGILEERPPYVSFERRAIEQRRPGPPEGDAGVFYIDVDYVKITPQGSKDVIEKPVQDWFKYLNKMVQDRRYNPKWLEAFQGAHKAWKEQHEVPLNGFAIKNWPVATPREVKMLADLRIHTVEDLAQASEEALGRIGMGARSLKQRASDWITAQTSTAPLVSQLDSLRVVNEELTRKVEELTKENKQLGAELQQFRLHERGIKQPVGSPSLDDRLAAAQGTAGPDFVEEFTKL